MSSSSSDDEDDELGAMIYRSFKQEEAAKQRTSSIPFSPVVPVAAAAAVAVAAAAAAAASQNGMIPNIDAKIPNPPDAENNIKYTPDKPKRSRVKVEPYDPCPTKRYRPIDSTDESTYKEEEADTAYKEDTSADNEEAAINHCARYKTIHGKKKRVCTKAGCTNLMEYRFSGLCRKHEKGGEGIIIQDSYILVAGRKRQLCKHDLCRRRSQFQGLCAVHAERNGRVGSDGAYIMSCGRKRKICTHESCLNWVQHKRTLYCDKHAYLQVSGKRGNWYGGIHMKLSEDSVAATATADPVVKVDDSAATVAETDAPRAVKVDDSVTTVAEADDPTAVKVDDSAATIAEADAPRAVKVDDSGDVNADAPIAVKVDATVTETDAPRAVKVDDSGDVDADAPIDVKVDATVAEADAPRAVKVDDSITTVAETDAPIAVKVDAAVAEADAPRAVKVDDSATTVKVDALDRKEEACTAMGGSKDKEQILRHEKEGCATSINADTFKKFRGTIEEEPDDTHGRYTIYNGKKRMMCIKEGCTRVVQCRRTELCRPHNQDRIKKQKRQTADERLKEDVKEAEEKARRNGTTCTPIIDVYEIRGKRKRLVCRHLLCSSIAQRKGLCRIHEREQVQSKMLCMPVAAADKKYKESNCRYRRKVCLDPKCVSAVQKDGLCRRHYELGRPKTDEGLPVATKSGRGTNGYTSGVLKPIIKRGDKVYARWSGPHGTGTTWFPGCISEMRKDMSTNHWEYGPVKSYDILFDDGDKENNIKELHVMKKGEYEVCCKKPRVGEWVGVRNVRFGESVDEYARLIGWYAVDFNGSDGVMMFTRMYSSLAEAMRAYDKHIVQTKGGNISAPELNLPEEHGFHGGY